MKEGEKYPLIVITGGASYNYNGTNRGVQVICSAARRVLELCNEAILLFPQLHFGYDWRKNGGPAVAMLKHFILEFPQVDEKRIYITGQSAGSVATWSYLQYCPELFACAMPGSGGPRYEGMNMNSLKPGQIEEILQGIVASDTPVFIHHGAADPMAFLYESAEAIVMLIQMYKDKGYSVETIEKLVPIQIYTKKKYGAGSGHLIGGLMYSRENIEKMLSYRRK